MFAGGTGTPVGPARLGCGVFAMGSQVKGGSEGPPPLPAPWTPSFCPNFFKLMFFYCRALKIPSIDSPVCPRQTQRGHNRRTEGPSAVPPHTPLCPFPNLPSSVNGSAPPPPQLLTPTLRCCAGLTGGPRKTWPGSKPWALWAWPCVGVALWAWSRVGVALFGVFAELGGGGAAPPSCFPLL